ncbi:MAG TPA: hypothetical protein VFZ69_03880 [Longimicrobiales bacterium]
MNRVVPTLACVAVMLAGADGGVAQQSTDPRAALRGGWKDAESANSNMELVASVERPEGFFDANSLGNILLANSDIAFRGNALFLGNFHGFNIYDISDAVAPRLRASVVCPGGQGDMSVHGNLLFMSVEMPNGQVDCGTGGAMSNAPSTERFIGVRIFDISDLDSPRQITGVQTCRGSHTHTLVTDPADSENVYIYVSGTSTVRPEAELAGCSGRPPEEDPNTAYFRIEVIRVPLDAPQNATIVNAPRIFADPQTGAIAGLWRGGAHGAGTQQTAVTDQCHDLTAYPAIGLAAGACSGNGILLDISDAANPKRIDEVIDPNFAYWHSATFNNAGDKILFTDEWGGGMAARCRASDDPKWGANAIFTVHNGELTHRGYYKLPAPQTEQENCVAHNGSLIPVPGRDIMVQAWYQGGISVFDFTDPANPIEIAYFDRGPMNPSELLLGGHWSAYWYNGNIYASEIGRGLDVLRLTPSEYLSENEIEAAKLVRLESFNPQTQPRIVWPAHFTVARAYIDQLRRGNAVPANQLATIATSLDRAESQSGAERRSTLTEAAAVVNGLKAGANGVDAQRLELLASVLAEL